MATILLTDDGNTSIARDSDNTLIIRTKDKRITDEQMEGLFAIVILMNKTGKTLKELLSAV